LDFNVVNLSVTAVDGNRQRLDGGAMFGNAPRTVWEKWITPDELGRIPLNCRAMLLNINGKKVLCETGIGNFFEPKLADRYGVFEASHKLIDNLTALGIKETEIDFVILSHLHFDHAGGLLSSWSKENPDNKRLLFPNAKIVISRDAMERAKSPHPRDKASFIPELTSLIEASGRMIIVEGSTHPLVLPEVISFHFTHGHTPGHMHTIANSGTQRVVFAGDLIPGRAWVHLPITMGYDRFAEQVIDEKKYFYENFADSSTFVFYTHDHECAMSKIRLSDKNRYEPSNEIANPVHYAL
jgi:glyoxylase-like metal-dependent hydrolase (beta-lactamase superfamily II)